MKGCSFAQAWHFRGTVCLAAIVVAVSGADANIHSPSGGLTHAAAYHFPGQSQEEKKAEEWADRLAPYAADTTPGSKGDYGVPMSNVDEILSRRAHYEEAKALYEEFKKSGIDKDAHWKLRQAEYAIRIAIEGYEGCIERVFAEGEADLQHWATWIAGQKAAEKPLPISTREMNGIRERYSTVRRLLPETEPRRKALEALMAQLEKDQAAVESRVLKSRKMKADAYKGADSTAVKRIAKSVVEQELRKSEYGNEKGQVLRVHIVSAAWNTESAVEWTDTTKTAVQSRVTKGLTVQVVAKSGASCFLYTLFVHKDTVGGSQSGLLGHVMFRDKFLEANLPK